MRSHYNENSLHDYGNNTRLSFSVNEPDELCASMYSFHSSPEEKNKILFALAQHGIETTVDRAEKKRRIRAWIQESVIQEDQEGEDAEEEVATRLISPAPIIGHVSSIRATEKVHRKQIVSTVKDSSNKHRNPRTGEIESGPSEMGSSPVEMNQNKKPQSTASNGNVNVSTYADVGSQTSNDSTSQQNSSNSTLCRALDRSLPSDENLSNSYLSHYQSAVSVINSSSLATLPMMETNDRQSQLQRHHSTTLAQQTKPINSIETKGYLINDSAYGSLDRLRTPNGNSILSSPILAKRSIIQSKISKAQSLRMNFK